jgi:hypothetical protein
MVDTPEFKDGTEPAGPVVADPAPPAEPLSLEPDEDAPYGYTIDRATKERRPKKLPGRPQPGATRAAPAGNEPTGAALPGSSPSIDELKATKRPKGQEDRAPGKPRKGRTAKPKFNEADVPAFRAGPIAKGVNKLYARAGKLVKVMDPDIGNAVLATTRKESDDDVTVGEAWEELARTNPRIRAFLLKLIAGGAWGQLIMVHAPIFMAVIMKDGIRKHIPFLKLIEAMLGDDDDGTPSDISSALGGLNPEDLGSMMNMAQGLMAQMAGGVGRGAGTGRPVVVVTPEGPTDGG